MNRSRWISLGFVGLFIIVTVVVPAWKERAGLVVHKSTDTGYAALVLLCMGLVCVWSADKVSRGEPDAASDAAGYEPELGSREHGSVRSVGWLLLVLSIVIAAADLIR
jgi:hypothetical protein